MTHEESREKRFAMDLNLLDQVWDLLERREALGQDVTAEKLKIIERRSLLLGLTQED